MINRRDFTQAAAGFIGLSALTGAVPAPAQTLNKTVCILTGFPPRRLG